MPESCSWKRYHDRLNECGAAYGLPPGDRFGLADGDIVQAVVSCAKPLGHDGRHEGPIVFEHGNDQHLTVHWNLARASRQ